MKQIFQKVLIGLLIFTMLFPSTVYAVGEGNIDSGGGGMGQGTN